MVRLVVVPAIAGAVLLWPAIGRPEISITLEEALAAARTHAPSLIAARARVDEARARVLGASVLLRDNPVLEAVGGPRLSDDRTSPELDLALSQTFELGGRRRARVDAADAAVARQAAAGDDEARRVLRDAAAAFWRVVAAQERARLIRGAVRLAEELERTAERRRELGDIAELDVNVTRTAAARARADLASAAANEITEGAELKVLLGITAQEAIAAHGDLHRHPEYDLQALLAASDDRPDLRVIAAELREAEADVRLGRGLAWPEFGVRAGYQREESVAIPVAGLTIAIPIFARGQELRAAGHARAQRLRRELAAKRQVVDVQVGTAFDAYLRRRAAANELARAVPRLDENDELARRSYEAGELSLPELLVLRRETLVTRSEHLDRLLEAAISAVELEAHAGVLR